MRVELSKPAEDALVAHWEFLLEAYDEDYSLRTFEMLDDAMLYLGKHPGAGQLETNLDHLGRGHRRWVVGYYKLVYLVFKDRLVITDVFDTRQDPRKMKG